MRNALNYSAEQNALLQALFQGFCLTLYVKITFFCNLVFQL